MPARASSNARPTHPGATLLDEFLRPTGTTQKLFADHTGISAVRVNQIIKGHRGITPDTALRFSRVLGTAPEFWLERQVLWDLYKVQKSPAAAEIRRLKPLKLKKVRGAGSGRR